MKSLAFILLAVLPLGGCATSAAAPTNEALASAAVALAVESLRHEIGPIPITPDKQVCPNCNGTGKVGDGVVFDTCGQCDGTGIIKASSRPDELDESARETSPIDDVTPIASELPTSTQQCGSSSCGGETQRARRQGRRRLFNGRILRRVFGRRR